MREYRFDIRDTKIYERIKAESGLTAHTRATEGQADKLAVLTVVTDDEKRIIDEYIPLAINECIAAINHHLPSCSVTGENDPGDAKYKIRHFDIMLPDNYPEENTTSLNTLVMDVICNRCLQQWYMLVRADDTNTHATKAQSSIALLHNILNMRKRPL